MADVDIESCDICGDSWHETGQCPDLMPDNGANSSMAEMTLPKTMYMYVTANNKKGVVAKSNIPAKTRFGPFECKKSTLEIDMPNHLIFKIFSKEGKTITLDSSTEECNWMCLVEAAHTNEDQNCIAFQIGTDIFFCTTKQLNPGNILKVWYAPNYARKVGRSPQPDGKTCTLLGEQVTWVDDKPVTSASSQKRKRGRPRKRSPVSSRVEDEHSTIEESRVTPETPEKDDNIHVIVYNSDDQRPKRRISIPKRFESDYTVYTVEHENAPGDTNPEDMNDVTNEVEVVVPTVSDTLFKDPRKCSSCTKTFTSCSDMATHIRLHLKEKMKADVDLTPKKDQEETETCTENNEEQDNGTKDSEDGVVNTGTENENDQKSDGEAKEEITTKQMLLNPDFFMEEDGTVVFLCKCRKTFPVIDDVAAHILKGECSQVACTTCMAILDKKEDLETHICDIKERFPCDKCEKVFANKSSLDRHVCIMDTDDSYYKCELCCVQFTSVQFLYNHMAAHTGQYRCNKCDATFTRNHSLALHLVKCNKEQLSELYKGALNSCTECCRVFVEKTALHNHIAQHKGDFRCTVCNVRYTSKQRLNKHICRLNDQSESSQQYKCSECDQLFTSKAYLSRHMTTKHCSRYQCGLCSRTFPRREDIVKHFPRCETIKVEDNGIIKCDRCDEIFTEVRLYKKHYMNHNQPYQCSNCKRRFARDFSRDLHQKRCTMTVEDLTCKECGKVYQDISSLQNHVLVHGEPKFQCDACKKYFHRKMTRNNHTCHRPDGSVVRIKTFSRKNVTTIEEPNVCYICGKSYMTKSNLNKHIQTHGEKKIVCEICDKKFYHKHAMLVHRQQVHSTEPPKFQCLECGRMVRSKATLQAHKKQFHTANLEFHKCDECGRMFRQKGNLEKHKLKHSDKKTFHCGHCDIKFKYPEQLRKHTLEHTRGRSIKCSHKHCNKQFLMQHELKKHVLEFHSGMTYVCPFCNETMRYRHTTRRHIKKKHPGQAGLLDDPDFLMSLLKPVSSRQEPLSRQRNIIKTIRAAPTEQHRILCYQICQQDDGSQQIEIKVDNSSLVSGQSMPSLQQTPNVEEMQIHVTDTGELQFPEGVQIQSIGGLTIQNGQSGQETVSAEEIIADANLTNEVVEVLQSLSGTSSTSDSQAGAAYLTDVLQSQNQETVAADNIIFVSPS